MPEVKHEIEAVMASYKEVYEDMRKTDESNMTSFYTKSSITCSIICSEH
jgi:hypothetical protein